MFAMFRLSCIFVSLGYTAVLDKAVRGLCISCVDINRRRLESENARLQAAVDVQTRRASDAAKKLTEVSKRLRDSTYGLQLKEREVTVFSFNALGS